MPDLDKSWEKVRSIYLPKFVGKARENQASKVVPFSQANMLLSLDPKSGGWCYGLSLGWLVSLKSPSSNGGFAEQVYTAAAANLGNKDAPGRYGNFSGFVSDVKTFQNYWPSKYQTEETVQNVGLNTQEWDHTFNDRFFRFSKVAEYITGKTKNSYFLVKSPNHCMAAACDKDGFHFFDPNFGEVVFPSPANFKTFFVFWFDQKGIQTAYKGSEGGGKNAPPASSLVLKLCHFS